MHKLPFIIGFASQAFAQIVNLFSDVGDVPDRAGAVVCDEDAAVFRDGDTDRPPPDQAVFRHETGEEVFVTAISMAVVHGDADDFVAGAIGAVP